MRFTVKVSEIVREAQREEQPRALKTFPITADNCDLAAIAVRAWATSECRDVRGINHGPGDTIVCLVYPQKR